MIEKIKEDFIETLSQKITDTVTAAIHSSEFNPLTKMDRAILAVELLKFHSESLSKSVSKHMHKVF